MPNPTEIRLALAERLAPAWIELPGVVAVVVSGSTARGLADAWSDLELGVYWSRPPTDAERDVAVDRLGADLARRVSASEPTGWFGVDNLRVEGFPVDVAMNTTDAVEGLVAAVVDARDLRDELVERAGMLAEVRPLAGHEWVAAWQPRLELDRSLALALVERALRLLPASALEVDLARDNPIRVMQRLLSWAEAGLRAVHPLNRRWFPGFKAALARLPELPVAPADSRARIARGLAGPTRAAGDALLDWLDDLLVLAEHAGAHVGPVRQRLHAPGRRPG